MKESLFQAKLIGSANIDFDNSILFGENSKYVLVYITLKYGWLSLVAVLISTFMFISNKKDYIEKLGKLDEAVYVEEAKIIKDNIAEVRDVREQWKNNSTSYADVTETFTKYWASQDAELVKYIKLGLKSEKINTVMRKNIRNNVLLVENIRKETY